MPKDATLETMIDFSDVQRHRDFVYQCTEGNRTKESRLTAVNAVRSKYF